jgi:mono/diheme cytochrome c family protein
MWRTAAVVLVSCLAADQAAAARPDSPRSDSLISRGLYIAQAADCASCHTTAGGKAFAGGEPLKTEFGVIYSTNITPDDQTGIGRWSEADFDRAVREGVRKDGSYLYPAMPYTNYTKITSQDMHALWAYVRSLQPVRHQVPADSLLFPMNVRSSVLVWRTLYFKPGAFQRDPKQSDEWNRGEYLVDVLGHCDQCHTPRSVAQGLKSNRELTGAQIEGWYAPNISGDALSKLRDMSDQDLERFLRSGDMGNNTKVVGPMQEVVHASLSHLTDADLHAMVIYLKHQEAAPSPLAPAPVKWPRQADAQGLYQQQCAGCHQNDGKGIPGTVPALAGNDAVTASDPSNVVMAMLEGFPPQGPWGAMASFSNSLSDEQIADIANYVRTAWGNDASPNATPWGVDGWRKYAQSPKDESRALLCPDLDAKILKPALDAGATNLQKAAGDRIAMTQLVRKYQSVVPSASRGEVVEALSTAYCRTLSSGNLSEARMGAQLAEFAQRAAIATDDRKSM